MPLEPYESKRDFEETPEPQGGEIAGEGRRFVVQEHDARRLHWDFRLEMDGVLKSWALPKGPSMNPADKRLAVATEDHPLDYITFSGVIPEGNYGAGRVAIWDSGDYEPLDPPNPAEGIARGKLTFRLNGMRLRGEFHMVKTRGGADWLMFKARDEFADGNWTLEHALHEEEEQGDVASSSVVVNEAGQARHPVEVNIGRPAPMPRDVSPMLATAVEEPFDDPNWLFEPKWDGYRVICYVDGPNIRFVSRNRIDLGECFPVLAKARDAVKAENAVIDGELVALDDNGLPSFQLLQSASGFGKRGRRRSDTLPSLLLFVFDLVYCNGHDLTDEPLADRKRLLAEIITPDHPLIRVTDHIQGAGKALFEQAGKSGVEGILAKDSRSRYEQRRSRKWLKIKTTKTIDVVIGGYTRGRGTRSHFGALAVGIVLPPPFRGDRGGFSNQLEYVGNVGGGFSEQTLREIYDLLQPLRTDECPFAESPKTDEPAEWVRPELVCEVRYAELTDDHRLRQPVFLRLRPDKSPQECNLPAIREPSFRNAEVAVPLTNPDKVYWPEDGITKAGMFDYYSRVAEVMVPHLADRPLILKRYPDGIRGEFFYQHNVEDAPEYVQTWLHEEGGEHVRYVICNNVSTLLYLANLGTIEIHPMNSRWDRFERPDRIVFDLDPGPDATPADVCKTAFAIRDLLDSIGLKSFPKTSGVSGVHIYVPIDPIYTHEQATAFAEAIANLIYNRNRRLVTIERMTKNRPDSAVYLDYLQNGEGKALVAPYSLRAQPGAPVSMPITYEELEDCPEPGYWTIRTAPDRIAQVGDLFADALTLKQNLGVALAKIEEASS